GLGFVADLDRQGFHHTRLGRRNFHAGLVRLAGDQRLIRLDAVASLDHYLNNIGAAAGADIRDTDFFHGFTGRLLVGRFLGDRLSTLLLSLFRRSTGRGFWLGSRSLEHQDQVAGADFVTDLDRDALDDTC